MLKGNIILPEYQRYFVWDEDKVKNLIDAFRSKQFVLPVTIGAFKNGNTSKNLILDGQQRLTSILLAYLGLFPDELTLKKKIESLANENDEQREEGEYLDDVFIWKFDRVTERGKTKEDIRNAITHGNYKEINLGIDDIFLKSIFLGISYLTIAR